MMKQYIVHFYVCEDYDLPVQVSAMNKDDAKSKAVEALEVMDIPLDMYPMVLNEYNMIDVFKHDSFTNCRSLDSYARANGYFKVCNRSTMFECYYYPITDVSVVRSSSKDRKRSGFLSRFRH